MVKSLVLIASAFMALPSSFAISQEAWNPLAMSGFERLPDTSTSIVFRFRDEIGYIISKAGFKNALEARSFCANLGLTLGEIEEVLLLGMSGAANVDADLRAALNADGSELMMWIPERFASAPEIKGADVIVIGPGMSTRFAELSKVNFMLSKSGVPEIALRAICAKKLK